MFQVPLPIGVVPELKALVTLKAEGLILQRFYPLSIFSSPHHRKRLPTVFANIGKWLASFHESMTTTHETQTAQSLVNSMTMSLKATLQDILPQQYIRGIAERISMDVAESGLDDLKLVFSHGDFCPRHIFVGPETITVLDFSETLMASCYHDITSLLAYLDNSLFPVLSARMLKACALAFLNGYFGFHAVLQDMIPMLTAFMVVQAAKLTWTYQHKRVHPANMIVVRWLRRRAIAFLDDYYNEGLQNWSYDSGNPKAWKRQAGPKQPKLAST
jgi:Ser/Thr protein kinase RdoA (MazF antagonist)